jgi:ribosomal protein S11
VDEKNNNTTSTIRDERWNRRTSSKTSGLIGFRGIRLNGSSPFSVIAVSLQRNKM